MLSDLHRLRELRPQMCLTRKVKRSLLGKKSDVGQDLIYINKEGCLKRSK
jgi:hypothetical protein